MSQRRRSRIQLLALTALLGMALIALSQCRNVSDKITGVDLSAPATLSGRSACTHKCNDQYKAAQNSEKARHQQALKACGNNKDCRQSESQKHQEMQRQIQEDKKQCKKGCYNEGSGHGA